MRIFLPVLLVAVLLIPADAPAFWHPVDANLGFWGVCIVPYGNGLVVGGLIPHGVALWDGPILKPLGGGVPSGYPTALAVQEGTLFMGGSFVVAGADTVNRIARWDGSAWRPLGTGLNGPVSALAVYNGRLIAGGSFTLAGGAGASAVAQWDGSAWAPLGPGVDGTVSSLAVYDGDLVAAGHFTRAGGGLAANIARWDGLTWQPLGSGIGDPFSDITWGPVVWALAVHDGRLVAGGIFSRAGGVLARNIAQWDGASWSPLGSGISGGVVVDGAVGTLAVYQGDLIAAGLFERAGSVVAANIARWDGASWSFLGSGLDFGVLGLAVQDGSLYAVGAFRRADNLRAEYIARWDDTPGQDDTRPPVVLPPGDASGDDSLVPSLQGGSDARTSMMAASLGSDSLAPSPETTVQLLVHGRTISFNLERSTPGTLELFDVQGALVRTLEHGMLGFGRQEVVWDGRDDGGVRARSGWYYCRLRAGGMSGTSRLLYVK